MGRIWQAELFLAVLKTGNKLEQLIRWVIVGGDDGQEERSKGAYCIDIPTAWQGLHSAINQTADHPHSVIRYRESIHEYTS
jgi:hypothetical protein